ncbi:hypothetical protein N9C66_08090 [Akkermansiaceae bacterium]|nr:hypothetical protein [Akkermansiaceae bacterium]
MIRLIDERVMEKLRDKPENIDLEEFVPLVGEWREETSAKPKCPYCVNPIQKQATKCTQCLSVLEWFKFDGLYGSCKAGASEEMNRVLLSAKTTFHAFKLAAKEAEIKADEEGLRELLHKLATRKCAKCKAPVFSSNKLEKKNWLEAKELYNHPAFYNKCELCEKKSEMVATLIGILFIALILVLAFATN